MLYVSSEINSMIGSQPTDSKNSSDNRRFTTDTISTFRGYYESHLKGSFTPSEQQKVEERIFLKDIQLETLHSNFSSGQITQEQLIAKIKQSAQPAEVPKAEEIPPKLDEVVRRNVMIVVTQRSNMSSSGPMPEIRLSGVLNGETSTAGPTLEFQQQPQKLKSTPELTFVAPVVKPAPQNFKHNLLNFVLQHEGLSYEIIENFLKHQGMQDHQVCHALTSGLQTHFGRVRSEPVREHHETGFRRRQTVQVAQTEC